MGTPYRPGDGASLTEVLETGLTPDRFLTLFHKRYPAAQVELLDVRKPRVLIGVRTPGDTTHHLIPAHRLLSFISVFGSFRPAAGWTRGIA